MQVGSSPCHVSRPAVLHARFFSLSDIVEGHIFVFEVATSCRGNLGVQPGSQLSFSVSASGRFETGTSGQATSSGVVEGICGVGLRAKHPVGMSLNGL